MGRFPRISGGTSRAKRDADLEASADWWDDIARAARSHGAMPYVVEGFGEIVDAVRRGHSVLVRREQVEVADDVTIFREGSTAVTGAFTPPNSAQTNPVVAILRFDVGTARFVLQDAGSATGSVQLTPKRLQRYLDDPQRSTGVALGA